jgi:GntR family transcriptional regulator
MNGTWRVRGMTEPMYRQIAEDLRARIESGAIAQGAKLPTESDLRVGYGAARNTVREAVKLLASRGLVETRPGLGTFVTRHVEPFVTTLAARESTLSGGIGDDEEFLAGIRAQGRTPSASGPQVIVQPAPDDIAVRLDVPPGTQVVGRRRERYIDGRPWSLRTSYYPLEFVARGATDLVRAEGLPGGATSYLEQRLGLVQVGYREHILVRPPTVDEAKFLGLPDDGRASVVAVVRTSYWSAGDELAPFRVRVTVLPADRVVLVINSGTVPEDATVPDGTAPYGTASDDRAAPAVA